MRQIRLRHHRVCLRESCLRPSSWTGSLSSLVIRSPALRPDAGASRSTPTTRRTAAKEERLLRKLQRRIAGRTTKQEDFYALEEVKAPIEEWKNQYNTLLPHRSL